MRIAPLLSLDAVVIDTETTGLDPRKARVIELAGVRVIGGKLADDESFRQLLRPGDELIPAETTRIHISTMRRSPLRRCSRRSGRSFSALRRLELRDRAHRRLRSGGAEAGMRPRRPALDPAAHARHQAAGADRRARTGRLHAGKSRGLARRRDGRPACRARRCHHHGADLSGAGAEAARARHPHRRRSRAGLRGADSRCSTIRRAAAGSRRSRRRPGSMPSGP